MLAALRKNLSKNCSNSLKRLKIAENNRMLCKCHIKQVFQPLKAIRFYKGNAVYSQGKQEGVTLFLCLLVRIKKARRLAYRF